MTVPVKPLARTVGTRPGVIKACFRLFHLLKLTRQRNKLWRGAGPGRAWASGARSEGVPDMNLLDPIIAITGPGSLVALDLLYI